MLVVLSEAGLINGGALGPTEVFGGKEDSPKTNVVLIIRPAHVVVLAVLSRVVHVVHNVHVSI